MDANAPSVIDLLLFHTMERNLFTRLTGCMGRDPERTKLVLALWLWFESIGHHDFIRHVYSFVDDVVLQFYQEAEAGLGCLLHFRSVSDDDDNKEIPLTASLVNEPMDVRFFEYHRDVAVSGIIRIFNKVCRVIFNDNLIQMAARDHPAPSAPVVSSGFIIRPSGEGSGRQCAPIAGEASGSLGEAAAATAVVTPRDHPVPSAPVVSSGFIIRPSGEGSGRQCAPIAGEASGSLGEAAAATAVVTPPPAMVAPAGNTGGAMRVAVVGSKLNPMARPWTPGQAHSSEDQRSMFITFSKGHPIHRRYGNSVEVVMIEKVRPGCPPMYGRVVFTSAMMIAFVLNGQRTAKFMIKGKHLWARMYVPRSQN